MEVWEKLRSGALSPKTKASAVEAIRSLLFEGTTAHPDFQQFLTAADETQLTDFLQSVEWVTSQPGIDELQDRISSTLIASGRAADEGDSQRLLERLFLHVFQVLSGRGNKALTVASLEQQVSRPILEPSEEKLLAVLGQTVRFVISKIDRIEGTVREQGQRLDNISEQVLAITSQPEWSLYRGVADIQGFPKAVDPIVLRVTQSESLRDGFAANTWMALDGALQSGKTQLALQVVPHFAKSSIWIRLDGLSVREQCLRIDLPDVGYEASARGYSRRMVCAICEKLGAGNLIVLDGLMFTAADRDLMDRLLLLKEACQRFGLKVLSTSSGRFPQHCRSNGQGVGQRMSQSSMNRKKPSYFVCLVLRKRC